jgi:hypothetical protein
MSDMIFGWDSRVGVPAMQETVTTMPGQMPSIAGARWSVQEIVLRYLRNCSTDTSINLPEAVRRSCFAYSIGCSVCVRPRVA